MVDDGMTALMSASLHGHESTARALVELGADANQEDEDDQTALMMASEFGRESTVRALVGLGADANQAKASGWTALMSASANGHVSTARALVTQGADVEQMTKSIQLKHAHELTWGDVPPEDDPDDEESVAPSTTDSLATQCSYGEDSSPGECVSAYSCSICWKPVLQSWRCEACDFDACQTCHANGNRSIGGATALMLASELGHTEAAHILLKRGADVGQMRGDSETARSLARARGHRALVFNVLDPGR
jgi:ankyrin repeat protein